MESLIISTPQFESPDSEPHPKCEAFPTMEEWDAIADQVRWSRRECSVVRMLSLGIPRKRVAYIHSISKSTLQTHLQRAFWKADVDNLFAIVWWAIEVRDRIRCLDG